MKRKERERLGPITLGIDHDFSVVVMFEGFNARFTQEQAAVFRDSLTGCIEKAQELQAEYVEERVNGRP